MSEEIDWNARLLDAALIGDLELAKKALAAGADVSVRDNSGRTPLHRATGNGHAGMVRLLLEAGADVDMRDENIGASPLHEACGEDRVDVALLLLEAGADPNARDKWRGTPLHWAATHGHFGMIRLLLDYEADPNARDGKEWTPLHHAVFRGCVESVRLLLQAGADLGARDREGKTPLGLARQKVRRRIAAALEHALFQRKQQSEFDALMEMTRCAGGCFREEEPGDDGPQGRGGGAGPPRDG